MNAETLMVIIEEARSREDMLTVRRRVLLYRGLAELCGDQHEAARFRTLADELELAARKCEQFTFHFPLSPTGPAPAGDQVANLAT